MTDAAFTVRGIKNIKTRSSRMATLRHFLQRSAALRLYRDVLRIAKQAPPDARRSIREEARREFDTARRQNPNPDSSQVDFLVSKGQEKLENLKTMLHLSRS